MFNIKILWLVHYYVNAAFWFYLQFYYRELIWTWSILLIAG